MNPPSHRDKSPPRRRGKLVVPLLASAVLHAIVCAALARLAPRPPASTPRPLAIELVEVPAPVSERRSAAPRSSSPAGHGGDSRPGPSAGGPPRAPAPALLGAEVPGTPARQAPPRPVDLAAEGLAVEPAPDAAPDLRLRLRLGGGDATRAAPSRAPGEPSPALERWSADLAARGRVESGLAHPYCGELGRALARAWNPRRVLEARGVSGYLAQAGDNLKSFARVWRRVAEQFAGDGAPAVLDGKSERFRDLTALPPGPARDALIQSEVQRQLRRAFSEGHVATVRVVQATDGRLRSVELLAPSRDAAVDAEAVAAVRRAAESLPPPPPEALVGMDALVTTWEFEVEVSITPPVPVVGLEFDEVLGAGDIRVPLDRRIWKKVRLVGVG